MVLSTVVEPKFELYLRSTQPYWTSFLTLRANRIQLNPNLWSKIGFNPKNGSDLAALTFKVVIALDLTYSR